MDKRWTKADVKDPSERRAFLSSEEETNKYASKSKLKYESSKPDYSHKGYAKVPKEEPNDKKTHPSWK